MAGDWTTTTLGDCAEWMSGGTPSKANSAYWTGDIPWVSAKDMKSFRLHDAEDHISSDAVGNGGKMISAGDILLLVRGMTLHNDVPICMAMRDMAFNQDIKAIRAVAGVNSAFLAYWLLAHKPDLLASVDSAGHGTGRLVTETLKKRAVRLPPLPEQKRIAHILGTLDDKIELNRRMNVTLEGISRAIFKSWFVDFDPVRHKAAGKQPVGMDAQTATLFPDSFEESEIGEVPKGWEVGRLVDVAEHPRRAARPGEMPIGTPYIGLEHMPRRCISLSDWDVGDGVESNKFEFRRGEILFGKLRPYFHKVGVAPVDGVCSTDIVVARPRSPEWFGYVLGHMSSDEFVAYTNAGSTGTKMPRTNWEDMSRYEAVLPPERVAEAFNDIVQGAFTSIASRIHQSRTLAALRDTLLPKLLSGEIRVPEPKEIAEEATS